MGRRYRWYACDSLRDGEQVPVQVDDSLKTRREEERLRTLPKEIVAIAGREYEKHGYGQTFERLCERGGLSVLEIVMLMADAYERLKAEKA